MLIDPQMLSISGASPLPSTIWERRVSGFGLGRRKCFSSSSATIVRRPSMPTRPTRTLVAAWPWPISILATWRCAYGAIGRPHSAAFQVSLKGMEDVARRDPTSIMAHKDRMIAYRKLSSLEALAGRYALAAAYADRELEAQAEKGVPPHAEHTGWVNEAPAPAISFVSWTSASTTRPWPV